ncbi:MAG: PD40 domain-containing protein [Planctomycetes bacterium]|nr:PD40 domain-containing protein [Planctomycetota bacterium]
MKRPNASILALALLAHGSTALAQTTTRITSGASSWSSPSTDKLGKTLIYTQGGTTILHTPSKSYAMPVAVSASSPFFSQGGKVLVYASDGDPLGTNDDGNDEVFLLDLNKRRTVQLTTTADPASASSVTTDKYGKRVVFLSDADLVTGSNADLNPEVFLYTVSTGVFEQLTDTTGVNQNRNPRISASGKLVVYDSDADPLTTNADGNVEIFLYAVGTATTTQLTTTTVGDCSRPSISADGRFVAFESDTTELAGANADGLDEVYRLDRKSSTFLRLTDSTEASDRAFVSGSGAYVVLESEGDLVVGGNLDGSNELYLAAITKAGVSTLTQVTAGAVGTSSRSATCDHLAKRIYFRSDADLTSQGSGDDHIFLYVR